MRTVNVHEAKTTLSRLLEEVERGKTVIIARNGKPIAELTAISRRALASEVAAIRKRHDLRVAGHSIREAIDEGHR
jgi:prevent-host-death family protein